MDKMYLAEKLNSIRNEMTHLWGGTFIMGGGAITIILTMNWDILKILFAFLGLGMAIIFVNAYITRKIELMKILSDLR